jgi:DNA repair protein RecO (recombination protein O)
MPLHTTEAIVIGGHNLGEADRIVSFFTRRHGKIRAVAKGSRRVRSRFGGTLELFTRGQLVFFEVPNRTLHRVNEFSVTESYSPLKNDLDRLGRGAYLVEVAGAAVEDAEPNEEIFLLLRDALDTLLSYDDVRLLRAFEIRLLRIAGYLLELYRCLLCRSPLEENGALAISPVSGGLVCSNCRQRARDALPISPEALAYLRSALVGNLQAAVTAPLSAQHGCELEATLRACTAYFLGKNLRTLTFLNRLQQPL